MKPLDIHTNGIKKTNVKPGKKVKLHEKLSIAEINDLIESKQKTK